MDNKSEKCMITAVIPVYNCEKYVETCVNSVVEAISAFSERYPDLSAEIIIINDGSTDNSLTICQRLAENIKYIRLENQTNCGVSVARNKGLALARGKLIAFVDADDLVGQNMFITLYDNMTPDCEIICSACKLLKEGGETTEYHFYEDSFTASSSIEKEKLICQLLDPSYLQPEKETVTAVGVPWGKLYKKVFLEENKLLSDRRISRMEDNVLNMWAFAKAGQVKYIDEPLYIYREEHIKSELIKPNSLTTANINEILKARKCFFECYPEYITDKVRKCMDIELSFFFYTSIVNSIYANLTRRNTILELASICNSDYYTEWINRMAKVANPVKRKILFILCKHKVYWPVYEYFRRKVRK